MAPDISHLTGGDGGAVEPNEPYKVKNYTLRDPANRKIKVLTIGAGVSGILMAYKIQKHCENAEHVIYEKNSDIGGTWLENRYPNAACDIPSHAYQFNFAPNPDWPEAYSKSPDIWKYLDKICDIFNLRKYMTFKTEVIQCVWDEESAQWHVKLKQTIGLETKEFEETCDLLFYAVGVLNNFKWPQIEGLNDFKGKVIHTARWPSEYQKEKWKDESVAIIGSGASSIQTLPGMQPFVKHIDVFVRTPVWFIPNIGGQATDHFYTKKEKEIFKNDVQAMISHGKNMEDDINSLWALFFTEGEAQRQTQEIYKARMKEYIKDERLLEGFTPKFGIGCRRVTPGDAYMNAIQKSNVNVHFSTVIKITSNSVITNTGTEHKVDTIICATGFDVSFVPRFPIIGRNGVSLEEKWATCPEAYLGLGIPEMPNFITFIGPSFPIENGSVIGPVTAVGDYAIQVIHKMQTDMIKSWVPRQDVTDAFNEHTQELLKETVWSEGCRSWYKNNNTGRINAIFPGSSLHYIQVIEEPRWEDFNIQYQNQLNQWAFLGKGFTIQDKKGRFETDCSPYMVVEKIDPKWMKDVIQAGRRSDALVVNKPKNTANSYWYRLFRFLYG